MTIAHGPTLYFWGGPSDGATIDAPIERRYAEPAEWWTRESDGYRRGTVGRHGRDDSVCFVIYVWKEVWET